ncbi:MULTISPECIES: hypothetical protein [unclassified Microcoleus]
MLKEERRKKKEKGFSYLEEKEEGFSYLGEKQEAIFRNGFSN